MYSIYMAQILDSSMLKYYLEPIISSCNLWKDKNLFVFMIANPVSGGFTRKKIAKKNKSILESASNVAKETSVVVKSVEFTLFETEYAGHGDEFVNTIFDFYKDNCVGNSENKILIITAGGDGTSHEVQSALIKLINESEENKKNIANDFCVFRLPFGTGNDGSDGRNLEESLLRLNFPAHIELQKAVKVSCQGKNSKKDSWFAFNIASIGIDAFITHMTNKMKSKLPGDFYKLWVDLACVFYTWFYKKVPAFMELFKENNSIATYDNKIEFALLGSSGHRTYGSNHLILPTDENCCITESVSLIKKLMIKHHFNDGTHYGKPYSVFYDADKIKIAYDEKILLQLDGESHLLTKDSFPIVMELTEPLISVIVLDD